MPEPFPWLFLCSFDFTHTTLLSPQGSPSPCDCCCCCCCRSDRDLVCLLRLSSPHLSELNSSTLPSPALFLGGMEASKKKSQPGILHCDPLALAAQDHDSQISSPRRAGLVNHRGHFTLRKSGLVDRADIFLPPWAGGCHLVLCLSTAYGCGVPGFEIRLRFHGSDCSRHACRSRIAKAMASFAVWM